MTETTQEIAGLQMTLQKNKGPHKSGSERKRAVNASRIALEATARTVSWMHETGLHGVRVSSQPAGHDGMIEVTFIALSDGAILGEQVKSLIRTYVLGGRFKREIAPTVGWKNFRVRVCKRTHPDTEYSWLIERRE